MVISQKKKTEALGLLKDYKGSNPYILRLQKDVILRNDINAFNDFAAEYVLMNYQRTPQVINKITKIADWYGEKKKEEWNLEFVPQKLLIKVLVGETTTTFHCLVQYRQSVAPTLWFIPKKAVLNNFLAEDYNLKVVDFEKYDSISTRKDPDRKLREHQKTAVKFLLSRKKCILADDPGMGKTTSLVVAALEGQFERVLIICPASIKTTWKRELEWYVDPSQIAIVEGIQGKNKGELETYLGYPVGKSGKTVAELKKEAEEKGKWKDNRFTIVNYDILSEFYKIPTSRSKESIDQALAESPMLQYILDHRSLVIIDEAHRLSNSTSIRYKVIKDLLKRGNPDGIYEVTGTPITNRPMNLYHVLSFLGDPITDNWEEYVKRYCDGFQIPAKGEKEKWERIFCSKYNIRNKYAMSDATREQCRQFIRKNARLIWINNGESNLDELKDRIAHIYLRRVKEDIPGMVNKNIHEIFYDLTESQKIEYDKLWEEYEKERLSINPDTQLNKALIEGGVYRQFLANAMVEHTIELAEDILESGKKVVIACCFDNELYTLQKHFGEICVIYNGKMNTKQKDLAKDSFMMDDKIRVMICNIQAASVGLTLTASPIVIFNQIEWTSSSNEQMMDRVHRISQKEDVDIYVQIFRDTLYEKMWNIVMRKQFIANSIIKKEEEK